MPDYKFKTIDEKGKVRGDTMIASNPMELEKRLKSMGFDLLSFDEQAKASGSLFGRKSITKRELINFTFHIEQLLKAGVPLLDCLRDIRDSLDYSHFTDVLQTIIDDIEGGKTMSLALSEHKHIFDDVYVTLVRVGEETGLLAKVLKEMAETLRWQDELAAHSRKIMIYPGIVIVVVLSVVTFLMIYLMPQLLPFIKNMGGDIPTHTKVLISVSSVFVNYWYVMLMTPFVIYGVVKVMAKNNPNIQYFIDGLKLKLWLFGPLTMKIKLARFANYFAMMYGSGITVLNALKISEGIMNNIMLEEAIRSARQRISEGMQISESFEATGVFPSMIVRMIKIGEDTGAMDDALLNVSYFYNREVRELVDKIEPTMMPALTIILGMMMGWIMLSVLGPVYDAIANIKL
ncbi:MAG: type II secretion system F family protein [Gammaproteobacteria bacterium]